MADFKRGRGNAPALLRNTAARAVKSWDQLMKPKSVVPTRVVSFSFLNVPFALNICTKDRHYAWLTEADLALFAIGPV